MRLRGWLIVGLVVGLALGLAAWGLDAVTPAGSQPCSEWAPC